jgi:hypothetical protein
MRKIDFRTSAYFSGSFMFTAVILLVVAVPVIFMNLICGIVLLLMSIVIFTTHHRLTVDLDRKVFHDYLWILGLKNGDKGKFENIEYLFINKGKVSQTMNMRVASTTVSKEVYNGYLKFSESDKIHLTTKNNKKDLIEKLRPISAALKVKVYDYSDGAVKEV